ncbi:MAG: ATP-binding protein [Adlercreutzia equolifaciens]
MLPSESLLPIARRATWRDTECLELVCGIANAGGGRLILDADVDSRGAVKRRTSRLMKTIPGLIAQSLNLTCAVELVLDSGRFCLEVVIPPANDPISFRGIFFFYKDGENHILDDEALDRLMQRDMEADVKWEQRPVVQASLDDLNMGLVTRFTGAARDTDLTVDLDGLGHRADAAPCGPHDRRQLPTNAGILLPHNRRTSTSPAPRCASGLEVTAAPIYEDEVFGSLIEQVHSTVELLFEKYLPEEEPAPHGTYRLGTAGGHGRPPRDAVHEAVLNALAHKNYDSGAPVQVSVFTDRLCIDNVGRPPRTWTVGALLGRHTSRPNNPNLVAALRSLGIIDGWGNGVSRIRMSCMEAGTPEPIFELRDDETMVCFPMDSDSLLTASITHANAINAAPMAELTCPKCSKRREPGRPSRTRASR